MIIFSSGGTSESRSELKSTNASGPLPEKSHVAGLWWGVGTSILKTLPQSDSNVQPG